MRNTLTRLRGWGLVRLPRCRTINQRVSGMEVPPPYSLPETCTATGHSRDLFFLRSVAFWLDLVCYLGGIWPLDYGAHTLLGIAGCLQVPAVSIISKCGQLVSDTRTCQFNCRAASTPVCVSDANSSMRLPQSSLLISGDAFCGACRYSVLLAPCAAWVGTMAVVSLVATPNVSGASDSLSSCDDGCINLRTRTVIDDGIC
jgi:hypothetical protein